MIDSLYEPFKKWSATGSVYIISDPHLEDEDCQYMRADWPAPQDYINKLKKIVHKNDTLICLGDVGNPEWFNQIKCYKVLILGNHDKGKNNYLKQKTTIECSIDGYKYQIINNKEHGYFDEVYEGPLMIAPHIMLSHEPCVSPFWCNIHGHAHQGNFHEPGSFNLAADVVGFGVVSLGTMIKNGMIKNNCVDIHRITIDTASLRKENYEKSNNN